ncbi:hypothetical protein E4663_04780 [Halobacillus salinus]|uniref:Prepilin-type N-terminal cleavage/methylation domain-containing protein n=2 Tax=Halobacillus salinus TaxID=192814 RepID=A0A4Z0H361_9BACI|nr:hypothetical protein E4663_04780 [Halobacillus salinus]
MYHREMGFTLIETLVGLLVTLIVLSMTSPLLHFMNTNSYHSELETRQFFLYVQQEINRSTDLFIGTSYVEMTDPDNRIIRIELFKDSVRRRVDGKGHEILLTAVNEINFKWNSNSLSIEVKKEGDTYEKQIHVSPKQ